MNANLLEAVNIFKSLGWESVNEENILQLPLGTVEQKKIAFAGLKSGEWGEFAKTGNNSYGWQSYIDVDKNSLALFAIRIGVDARRAVTISRSASRKLLLMVIKERGEKYTTDFITYANISRYRIHEHSSSLFGSLVVNLVDKLNLVIPQSVEYIKDWSVYAAINMGIKTRVSRDHDELPSFSQIERRFLEHIQVAISISAPATGYFGDVFREGIKRGWIEQNRAIEWVFFALDTAIRPGDRKVWLEILSELNISDDELCTRAQALIPLLSLGDSFMISQLSPILIEKVDDSLLIEILIASLSTKVKKAKQIVLKSALTRNCPQDSATILPWLSMLTEDSDKSIATLASKLIQHWQLEAMTFEKADNDIQGLWQKTPPVWQVPTFDLGTVSSEQLTELASKIVNQATLIHDITLEKFLAVANALAYREPETVRMSLRGLRSKDLPVLNGLMSWIKKETPVYGFDREGKVTHPPLTARDSVACLYLDKLPCLLSTPSFDDLSITVSDLTKRLVCYQQSGVSVCEADLFLALMRLNIATNTQALTQQLKQLTVSILLQSGENMAITAGPAVLNYLKNPLKELPFSTGHYWHKNIVIEKSLEDFPNRFSYYYQGEYFSTFPLWGDVALTEVCWDSEVYHEKGLVLRQVARRAKPLPAGAAINFLAAQRSSTPDSVEDSMLAVVEAWQRGLLRPEVADVSLLDWRSSPPTNLVALANALDEIAQDNMLSVVWPILDSLIAESLKAPRLLAGTIEIAELIAKFLPEVQYAVEQGLANKTALDLFNLRVLANRNGSSRAVDIAKTVVELLPVMEIPPQQQNKTLAVEQPFDDVWPKPNNPCHFIEDNVLISVDYVNSEAPTKHFLFTLTLPNMPDRLFQIVNSGWYYDLESEGQCRAYSVPFDTKKFTENRDNQVWLHWDDKTKSMLVCDHRNWVDNVAGSLPRDKATPLSLSLLTVIIGLLAQDGDAVYFVPRLLSELINKDKIDATVIRRATKVLLQNPVVSPAKLTRNLEKDIKLLPVLWPMLVECIKFAGELVKNGEKPPVWVNRILDIALRYSPYLLEAATRGYISEEDAKWTGLRDIAEAKVKSTAVKKAQEFLSRIENV